MKWTFANNKVFWGVGRRIKSNWLCSQVGNVNVILTVYQLFTEESSSIMSTNRIYVRWWFSRSLSETMSSLHTLYIKELCTSRERSRINKVTSAKLVNKTFKLQASEIKLKRAVLFILVASQISSIAFALCELRILLYLFPQQSHKLYIHRSFFAQDYVLINLICRAFLLSALVNVFFMPAKNNPLYEAEACC